MPGTADLVEAAPPLQALKRRFDLSIGAWLLAAACLVFLVVGPLLWIFVASVHHDGDEVLTLGNYVEAFSRSIYLKPIGTSLILATSVALIAGLFGIVLSWAVGRTDMPGRTLVRASVFAAFVTPSFLGATAWIFLAAPNSGWLNRAWVAATGAEHGPLNIYSLGGAIFVIACYSYPYTFAFASNALELIPADMERSAALLGAGWWRITWRITLPLVRPALIAGVLLSFLEAIAEFGTPSFLLIPAGRQVITTQLYLFFQFPTRSNLAAAYAIPLLLVTASLFLLQRHLLKRGRFTTVGGKGGTRAPFRLGWKRWPLFAFCMIPPLCSMVLPYGALLATSLSKAWGKGLVPDNLTLHWYRWALIDNADARHAIQHSLTYAGAAATIATVLAVFTAYVSLRRLLPGARILGFIAVAPFVVPGIILAIGFFSAYARPPLVLYGTGWMLIVAFATRFLPIAYSGSESALRSIDPELEHAARTLGSTALRTFARITLPLLKRSIVATWLVAFIPALRELSSAVFLFTPSTAVMTNLIFDLSDGGNFEPVSALGVIMMALTFLLIALAYRLLGRAVLMQRQGL
ncbi:MAG: iron ABC transporter permease [Myxococcales bacterium]